MPTAPSFPRAAPRQAERLAHFFNYTHPTTGICPEKPHHQRRDRQKVWFLKCRAVFPLSNLPLPSPRSCTDSPVPGRPPHDSRLRTFLHVFLLDPPFLP